MDKSAEHSRRRGGQELQVVHRAHEDGALRAARRPQVREPGGHPARRAHHGEERRPARAQGPGRAQREDEPLRRGGLSPLFIAAAATYRYRRGRINYGARPAHRRTGTETGTEEGARRRHCTICCNSRL